MRFVLFFFELNIDSYDVATFSGTHQGPAIWRFLGQEAQPVPSLFRSV